MSASQDFAEGQQHITPPASFVDPPLTPQPTGEKAFNQAARVLQLFRDHKAGRPTNGDPWTCFRLLPGEYHEIQRRVDRDEVLRGYLDHKIRYVC